MPVHLEVIEAARRLCRERGGWTFRPNEVVRALPHLNASTIRTHIVSRCCINAPKHHLHRWDYFRRIGRGVYEIVPALRNARRGTRVVARTAETAATYGRGSAVAPRDTVHVVVTRCRSWYVAECLELAVVTQGRTLDEVVANLREAIALHLEGEDPETLGVVAAPRISLTYEVTARSG